WIAIVTFGGTAALVQPPTQSREDLMATIDRFELQRGTAVGSGLLVALKTIFPAVEYELGSSDPRRKPTIPGLPDRRDATLGEQPASQFAPVPPGSYDSAVIILLSDGQTTTGPDPI